MTVCWTARTWKETNKRKERNKCWIYEFPAYVSRQTPVVNLYALWLDMHLRVPQKSRDTDMLTNDGEWLKSHYVTYLGSEIFD